MTYEYVSGTLTLIAFFGAYVYTLARRQKALERFVVQTVEVAGRAQISWLIPYVATHAQSDHEAVIDAIHALTSERKIILSGPEVISKNAWIEE